MYCPLCSSGRTAAFAELRGSRYLRCGACDLTFLSSDDRLDPEAERAHYGTHENDPSDPRYRAFLARLADPLIEVLSPGAEGLDYGAGPAPTLSKMLEERGFSMEVYDPFFAPDDRVLRRSYDFITCSEVAEHFFSPAAELDGLDRMLRPGGWLAVMTELLGEDEGFATWRYARDPTHVCFYRLRTLEWIADHYGWAVSWPDPNVVLFRKGPTVTMDLAEKAGSAGIAAR